MVQLSKILNDIDGSEYSLELGYIIFYLICHYFTGDAAMDRNLLEGLSPERIYFEDDWKKSMEFIFLDDPQPPFKALAYYPPAFASGKSEWDDSCSVFALCAILYRIGTCSLPYIDNPDEDIDVLIAQERAENITGERKYPLYLDCFHESVQNILRKGLSLDKEPRYQTLEEAFEDFKTIPLKKILYHNSNLQN